MGVRHGAGKEEPCKVSSSLGTVMIMKQIGVRLRCGIVLHIGLRYGLGWAMSNRVL